MLLAQYKTVCLQRVLEPFRALSLLSDRVSSDRPLGEQTMNCRVPLPLVTSTDPCHRIDSLMMSAGFCRLMPLFEVPFADDCFDYIYWTLCDVCLPLYSPNHILLLLLPLPHMPPASPCTFVLFPVIVVINAVIAVVGTDRWNDFSSWTLVKWRYSEARSPSLHTPQHPSWTTKTVQWLLVDRIRCAFYKN